MPLPQSLPAPPDTTGGGTRYHHHHDHHHNNRRRRRREDSYPSFSYKTHEDLSLSHPQDHVCEPAANPGGPPPLKRRRQEQRPAASGGGCVGGLELRWTNHRDPEPASPSRAAATTEADAEELMSRDEIERRSPSRRDGIDSALEARLRASYCAYLRCLGVRLGLPQTTMATATVLCHRFFFRRSHACHDRFLIATAALFLAAKSEETPCLLNTVLRASCEISQIQEFTLMPYMLHGNWFEQYRERVIEAEQMILTTLDFELEVVHPYASLSSSLNKLGLSHTVLFNVAWNLVNEGLSMKCHA